MKKQLWLLSLVLITAAAAVILLRNEAPQGDLQTQLLLPNLQAKADRITQVKVTNAQSTVLDGYVDQQGWMTRLESNQQPYPLAQTQLSDLVTALASARVLEQKTSKAENYLHLGLRDISDADSQASLIELQLAGEKISLLVGKQASSGQGSYVRLVGQPQTYLLDQSIAVPDNRIDWLKQPILHFGSEQLLSVSRLGEGSFTIEKRDAEDPASFQLLDLEPQQSLRYDTIVDSFIETLVGLRFESIDSVLPEAIVGMSPSSVLRLEWQGGQQLELMVFSNGDQHWVQLTNMISVGEFYWEGLSYQISGFAAGQIQKQLDDFIQLPEDDVSQGYDSVAEEGESPQ